MNYVFYVSDQDSMNLTNFSYKMESEREIANQIARSLGKCIVKKYTEYNGELVDGDSVGIVFPSRRWGMSLAVSAFLQNVRISKRAYVYAVAVGESVSGKVSNNYISAVKSLAQVDRIMAKRFNCGTDSIYVKCTDRARSVADTEYNMFGVVREENRVNSILNGLLYQNINQIENSEPMEENANTIAFDFEFDSRREKKYNRYKLTNIFLDDNIFAEDKLCRVI